MAWARIQEGEKVGWTSYQRADHRLQEALSGVSANLAPYAMSDTAEAATQALRVKPREWY